MDDQMPEGFEAGLTQAAPPQPPPSDDSMPEGFEAGLQPTQPTQQKPPQDPSLLSQFWAARPHPIEEAKGVLKGAGDTVAGLLDLYSKTPGGIVPGVAPGTSAGAAKIADTIRQHTQATNFSQEQGKIAETIAEFYALPEMEGESIASKIPTLSEHLADGSKLAKFLTENPKIARVLRTGIETAKGSARGATEQAGQTYIKTGGDVDATAEAGKVGAIVGGVFGGGAQGLREAGDAIEKGRPLPRNIAGADFETKGGDLLLRNLKANKVDPATTAVDEASGNIAQTGVANSLNRANAARPADIQPLPPSRQLPAPEGSPPAYSVGMGEPTETAEGDLLQPARKKQIATEVREGKGPGQFDVERYQTGQTPPPTGEGELTQRGSHREPVFQYLTDVKPGSPPPRADVTSGPGVMILTNDGEAMSSTKARAKYIQNESILNNEDALSEMTVKQHNDLLDEQQDLGEQLGRYDQYAANQPHLPEHNVLDAVRNTHSLQDGGNLLKKSYEPFWQAADDASGKQFTAIREEEKYLQKQLYSPNPIADYDGLMDKLEANKQRQMAFFDKYKTTVSPEEWETHREGYQDGIVMSNLGNFLEGKFNGITRADVADRPNLQRVFKPSADFNNQLEKFLNTGTNREVLQRTIGNDHILDLKEMGQLFEGAERQGATRTLIEHIGAAIRRHRWAAGGVGGTIGYGVGHGIGGVAGGLAGASGGALSVPLASGTVSGTIDYIQNQLASDPQFLKSFTYAVNNKVSPKFAAPLLMQRILSTGLNFDQKEPVRQPQKKEQ